MRKTFKAVTVVIFPNASINLFETLFPMDSHILKSYPLKIATHFFLYQKRKTSKPQKKLLNLKISNLKLLKYNVILYSILEVEFLSGIFTCNKKDGNKRMKLNLKKFSKYTIMLLILLNQMYI